MGAAVNAGLPDSEAQALWDQVADKSDLVGEMVSDIARQTVCGEQTRAELRQAGELLEQVGKILAVTSRREGRLHLERARLLGDDPDGGARAAGAIETDTTPDRAAQDGEMQS
jgi:hypothetical protein